MIYEEASPTFYAENVFQFETASVAHAFRWSSPFAVHVRRIQVVLSPVYKDYDNSSSHRADESWTSYLKAVNYCLASDFPNLHHMTVTLGRGLEIEKLSNLQEMLSPFKNYLRVRAFEIVGVNDRRLLPDLGAIVRPQNQTFGQRHGTMDIQTSVSEYKEMPGWVNAIMWWGKAGEKAPVKPRTFTGDCRYRRRLYVIDSDLPDGPYMSVGESFSSSDSL